jgi:hypothetical protein
MHIDFVITSKVTRVKALVGVDTDGADTGVWKRSQGTLDIGALHGVCWITAAKHMMFADSLAGTDEAIVMVLLRVGGARFNDVASNVHGEGSLMRGKQDDIVYAAV